MKKALIIVFFLSLISCGNTKTESSCDFNFFEKTSGIKFPQEKEIINCADDYEGIIWLNLKLKQEDASEFIENLNMHQFSNIINDETNKLYGSEDNQLVDHLKMFINDSIEPITKNSNTYLKTIDKENQYVIYILNKESGFFWGLIEYPDWAGN